MASFSDFFTLTAIFGAPKNTGRVPDIGLKEDSPAFRAQHEASGNKTRCSDPPPSQLSEVMHQRQSANDLNSRFFSVANQNLIQTQIQEQVSLKSGGKQKIDRQSDDDLFLIMRSYYLQYARNDPAVVEEELVSLNNRVVSYASDKIMVEIEAQRQQRRDQENFPTPLAAPTNVNVQGTRQNELKSFF